MSLFRAREWWSSKIGNGAEEFDNGCLVVGCLDTTETGHQEQVIVGSHSGFLRIYQPSHQQEAEDQSSINKTAEDLLLEKQLSAPILQILLGRFIVSNKQLALAVLHPRKLAVYSFSKAAGSVSHGLQFAIKLVYEHPLQRTAFNMCCGPFGKVNERDFICVQSVDCTLSVFEQESFAFQRFLPNSLIPGPLAYIATSDCFVTVSSSRCLEAFKYQVLAVATDTKSKEESQNLKHGKRVTADWTWNMGELATNIQVVASSDGNNLIMVLGMRNVYCISETGQLKFMRRHEVPPTSMHVFMVKNTSSVQYLLASPTGQIFVYRNTDMLWAAAWSQGAVELKVANFKDINGIVVSLSDNGHLDCLYLGTDPSLPKLPPADEIHDVDYDAQDQEMNVLQHRIKQASATSGGLTAPTPTARDTGSDLQIIVQLPKDIDTSSQAPNQDFGPVPSLTMSLILKPRVHLQNLQATIEVSKPVVASQNIFSFSYIDVNHPGDCVITFYVAEPCVVADLEVRVLASYTNVQNMPRVAQNRFSLPVTLVLQPCLPVKQATYKFTLDTNQPPVDLNQLFPEFVCEGVDTQGCALGVQCLAEGPSVTILASNKSQRYRLQSDTFEALWLPAKELVRRLKNHYNDAIEFGFSGALPLAEYVEVMNAHLAARQHLKELEETLEQRASQFRAIQKRLLTRFKDKTPQPLMNLDALLEGSMRQLMELAEKADETKTHVEQHSVSLAAATFLFCYSVRLSGAATGENADMMERVLSGKLRDFAQFGVEEQLDAALTHMLRSVLSKTARDVQLNAAPLTTPENTNRLQKHITMLVEKLGKGAKLTSAPPATSSIAMDSPSISGESALRAAEDEGSSPMKDFRSPRADKKKKKKKKKHRHHEKDGELASDSLNSIGDEDSPSHRRRLHDIEEVSSIKSSLSNLQDLDSLSSAPSATNGDNADDFYG